MAMEIFKLFGSIMVNNDEADKSISKTSDKAEGLGKKFLSGVGTAAKWGTAVVGAAVAGGTALFGMANNAAGVTDNVDKMSQKLGMSRKGFQEWEFICSQSGTSVEKLSSGMKGLATKMLDAEKGGKSSVAMFKELGINIKDTSGNLKSQEQVFEEAVIKLQNMEDGTKKAALANKLFGKAGQELMPLLNGAAGSVEEMKEKAAELGLVLSDDAIDAGVKFTDTIDQLKRSFSAVVTNIGVSVMPMIQSFCDWIMTKMPLIQSIIGAVFDVIGSFVGIVVGVLKGFRDAANDLFGKVVGKLIEMKDAFNNSMDQFDDYGEAFKSMMEVLFGPIGDLPIFEEIGKILSSINEIKNRIANGEGVGEAFRKAFEWRDSTVGNALLELMEFCTTIFTSIESVIKTIIQNLGPIFDGLKNLFSITMEALHSSWENIGKPIWQLFTIAVKKIAEVFQHVFPIIADIFKGVCDTLRNLWVSILKPVFDTIGTIIKNVLLPIFITSFNNMAEKVKLAFTLIGNLWNNSLKPILDGIINFISGVFSGNWSKAWSGITSILSGLWGGIKTIIWTPIEWAIGKISGITEKIISPFRKAKDSISNLWSSIKSVFKVPHFTFTGSMNPLKWAEQGTPKIGVEWYAKGGVLNKPTVFGMNGPNMMVGGEAGPEAVAPIETLMKYIDIAVRNAMESTGVKEKSENNMILNIYSPEPLRPSEIARKIKNEQRKAGFEFV